MTLDKASRRSRPIPRPIALVAVAVVFGLAVGAIWYFGSDHQDWTVKDLPPLPPAQPIQVSAQGIQELTLVVTPQGYNPVHFAVKRGVPVRLTFRQQGEVGCANTLVFPVAPGISSTLTLRSAADRQTLEFTPPEAGRFDFSCGHAMFRGAMTVTE